MKFTLQNSNWRIKKLHESGGTSSEKSSVKRWAARKRNQVGFLWKKPPIDFLREKAAADREIRQQDRSYVQNNRNSQQQMMKAMIPQQRQMNTAFLNIVEKLPNNWSAISVFIQNMLLPYKI